MQLDDLFDRLTSVLRPLGFIAEPGDEYRSPPLDVPRYDRRAVRLHWLPILGRGQSVVAVARQPLDLAFDPEAGRVLLQRLNAAVNGRFPPRKGATAALTAIIVTPEPIGPEDEAVLQTILANPPRGRVVPLGLFRVNLGQEALAFALKAGPPGVYPEPAALADSLCECLRRFVPPITF